MANNYYGTSSLIGYKLTNEPASTDTITIYLLCCRSLVQNLDDRRFRVLPASYPGAFDHINPRDMQAIEQHIAPSWVRGRSAVVTGQVTISQKSLGIRMVSSTIWINMHNSCSEIKIEPI